AMPAEKVDVGLQGVQKLVLVVSSMGDAINYDHADWADARFVVTGALPRTIEPPREEALTLTPRPSSTPRINGAKVFGVRPGSPFMFTIPATGKRPVKFSAKGLPVGLELDSASGRISGVLKDKGEWSVILGANNSAGATERELRIVCGDQ